MSNDITFCANADIEREECRDCRRAYAPKDEKYLSWANFREQGKEKCDYFFKKPL